MVFKRLCGYLLLSLLLVPGIWAQGRAVRPVPPDSSLASAHI